MTQAKTYKIYFAGDLFDHKHLIGNALLADYIESQSRGCYQCVLPQDLEQSSNRAVVIRNQDLLHVIDCDVALFNFDGVDLDSGTVVEFMLAKMLDIPAVLLRTDFRSGGDQGENGDRWNLMCSFYPRSETVQLNGMAWYQDARNAEPDMQATIETLYTRLASQIVVALDKARSAPSLLQGDLDKARSLYRWALTFPGTGLADLVDDDHADKTVARKAALDLFR